MTAVEHLTAWIESSRPHYDKLLALEIDRKEATGGRLNASLASRAFSIAASAYREACEGGDMFARDQSPKTILETACGLLEWEIEQ